MKVKFPFVAFAFAFALPLVAETRIGTVNIMMLARNHPDYERNKTLLTTTDRDYQKKLDEIKAEGEKLQEEGKKLVDQMRSPMLAEKAKADLEKQIGDLQQKLMGIEQRYRTEGMRCRQDLQELEGRLLKATTEDLRARIAKFAEANDYDLIVDAAATAFCKPEMDITGEILSAMGVDPKEAKSADEGK